MKFVLLLFIVLCTVYSVVGQQQCRYVTRTVCDDDGDDSSSSRNVMTTKGEKGDKGFPGKLGPKGSMGEFGRKGNNGDKGVKGNTAQVEELQEHLSDRINAMQSSLEQLLLPPNCASSSHVGYQMLRSGEYVYCDGGWMVFQKRFDGSVNFQRPWNDYKNGFGNFSTEFWLDGIDTSYRNGVPAQNLLRPEHRYAGLDKVHEATDGRGCRLRVDLWSFDDDHAFAEYSDFSVEDEADLYRIHIGGYKGTAGDCFGADNGYHDERAFTTLDRDNDNNPNNCATNVYGPSGGWWFGSCQNCKLNAGWGRSSGAWHNNVWNQWKGENEALKASTMKLRCD